jgi:hypothetical protein
MLAIMGLVIAGAAAGGAVAAFPDSNVDSYTGCLNAGGSSGGQISQVSTGPSPLKPCNANQQLVHLSGGDITKVTAGSGLSGGGENGAVTLSLDGGFQLPQSCAAGKIPQWDGSAWQCADDQTYTNGTGLDLNGNEFSVGSGYQLPQGCSDGQVATSKGDGTWKCQSSVGGLSVYTVPGSASVDDFYSEATAYAYCNGSDLATGGGFGTSNVDIKDAGPWNNGWRAHAEGGLFGGTVYVYVKCLHVQS